MIKRILIGLAGTAYAETKLRTAIEIAQRHGATVTAVTVIDFDSLRDLGAVPIGASQAAMELREHRIELTKEHAEVAIENFVAACQQANVPHSVLREERNTPFDFLMSQSRYHDLTILGLRGIFEYDVPGVLESDPSLTLVNLLSGGVRPIIAVPKVYRPVQRVLVAYSGSVGSASTLRQFLQMQPMGDVSLRIVTFDPQQERGEFLLEEAAKLCQAHGIEPELREVAKSPDGHLLEEAADWNADMIVLGNSARSLILRRVLGETALTVIRNAELALFLSQ